MRIRGISKRRQQRVHAVVSARKRRAPRQRPVIVKHFSQTDVFLPSRSASNVITTIGISQDITVFREGAIGREVAL